MEQHQEETGNEVSTEQGQAFLQIVRTVWQRRGLMILAVGVSLSLGFLYYFTAAPTYRSSAQVLVVKKRLEEGAGINTRGTGIEDYVATHVVLVTSPLIIERAIKKHALGALPMFDGWDKAFAAGGDSLPEQIKKRAVVTRSKAAQGILEVSFRGGNKEDCLTVTEAILDCYKEFLDETYRNMSDDTLALVIKARDVLEKDLEKKEAEYREFRANSPLLSARKDTPDIRREGLGTIQLKKSALLMRRAEIQAQLEAVETARTLGKSNDILLAMLAEFSYRAEGDDTQRKTGNSPIEQLIPLVAEEQKMRAGFGPNHPQVVGLRRKVDAARDALSRPNAAFVKSTDIADDTPARDPIQAHIDYLLQKLDYVEKAETRLSAVFDQEHAEARKLTRYEIQDEMFKAEIQRGQLLYETIIKRLQDLSLYKDVGGYDARVIAPPGIGRKVAPSGMLVLPVALALGLCVGAGLVYLAEITDRSFRSPEEVGRRLALPVVGYIPVLGADGKAATTIEGSAVDSSLCALHRPRSADAEAYRGVRTALYFGTKGKKNQVIHVTSPNPGDGKSTTAANLAVCIAQSDKRVLLVDADLRKPRVHELFGLSADRGLASLIAEEAEPADVIQPSGIPNLSVLPCGPLPANPAELLTSPRFREVLDTLRDEYEFVIVDSPPVLAVTDASIIASNVDGVILTVRMTSSARPPAERAREILSTMNATLVGVVVNGIDHRTRGGYAYGYTYGTYGDDGSDEDGAGRETVLRPAGPADEESGEEV